MGRELTPRTTLDSLRKEAKRWLRALRTGDEEARARLARLHPRAPAEPGLRHVQHALALDHGFASWARLKAGLADVQQQPSGSRERAVRALLVAAERGDAAAVADLLDQHPDIIDERGVLPGHTGLRTALHFGIEHESVVECLLARGADANVRDEGDAAMPLHFAAENQHLPVVRLLLEHGADPVGAGDHHELEVIGWATCFEYVTANRDIVAYLIAHGAQHNIFSAVATGETDSIPRLVGRSRAELDRRMDLTNHRRRPLHLAVVKKQPDSLRVLLELGADLEAVDQGGLTALDQAAFDGEAELAQLLIERGAEVRLPAAVALGRADDIERLLRDEPDCLRPGQRWGTLIVRASGRASGEVIETLIRLGASVDVADDPETAIDSTSNFTPLHAAAWTGNAAAASVLMKRGANLSTRDLKYGGTPASWAHYAGRTAVRDLILQGDVDLFEALAFDLTDRFSDIVRRDPQALNRPFGEYATLPPHDGQWWPDPWCTPIAWAVIKNKAMAVRLLLELGAERTVAPDARTLHDLAGGEGREAVAAALRDPLD